MKKLINIFLFFLILPSSIWAQDLIEMKVSLNIENKAIYVALEQLETNYDEIRFSYSPDLLDLQKKITVTAEQVPLKQVLNDLFENTQIEYVEINHNIALRIRQVNDAESDITKSNTNTTSNTPQNTTSQSQINARLNGGEYTVTGTVVDESGEPLPGATVLIKNTFNGTSTDIDGKYSIQLKSRSDNTVLVYDFLGMEPVEVAVKGRFIVNVVLKDGELNLSEVVVVGYGTKRKSDVIGSMSTIKSKEIEYAVPSTIDKMLEGVAPGLMVSSTSSEPGAKTAVRIRGESSIDGENAPLYIVDGVPFTTSIEMELFDGFSYNPLAAINPNQIETITVLKDAAATSIYGANASNGVILITTKRGKEGKTKVSISSNIGVQTRLDNSYDRLSGPEYVELMMEASLNAGFTPEQAASKVGRTDVDTNWPSLMYKTGLSQNYNMSASGGSEKFKFYSSIGFNKQEGVVKGNSLQKTSIRINLDHEIGNKGELHYSLAPTFSQKEYFTTLGDVNEILPNLPVYNADGSYNTDVKYNPVAILNQNEYNGDGSRILASIKLDYDLTKRIQFYSTYGLDHYNNTDKQYLSMLNQTGAAKKGQAARTNTKNFRWYWNNMLKFNIHKDKNKLNGLLAFELNDSEVNTVSARASNFPNDFMRELSSGSVPEYAGSRRSETSQVSYFAKLDYSFNNKIFINSSFRNDASSIFGGDTKASNKGSFGASWIISNEKWFNEKLPQLSLFKLRGSLGTMGNSRIGSYASRGVYSYNGADYNNQPGSAPLYGDNPGLSWETSFILNLATDFSINERLSGTVEYYLKNNYNLLTKTAVSETTGFSSSTQNLGDSRNTGWEITLKSKLIDHNSFRWNTSLMNSFEKSYFTKLYHGNGRDLGTRIIKEGESVRAIYLVRWAGVDPQTGAPLWYDLDNNIVDYASRNNRVVVGSGLPDFYGSLTNTFSYKNISLRLFMTYTYGNMVYNSNRANSESDGEYLATKNQNKNQLKRWQKPGDITDVPKIVLGNEANGNYSSTRFLEDGSHINLKNVSLSYTVKDNIKEKLKIDYLRFSLAVDNVFIFAGFKSLSTANGRLSTYYPDMRTIQFSMSLGL